MTGRGEKRAYRLCGVRVGCDFTAGALLTVIEKVSLLEQKMELCFPGGITNSGTFHSTSGFRHSVFLYQGKRLLVQLMVSMLQHQSTAPRAVCPRTAAGCAAGGAAGCPGLWCRAGSLLCPRGCVPGQGLCRLPGSALSLPGELPRALRGDVWGEGAPRQGRAGAFCCHSCCLG